MMTQAQSLARNLKRARAALDDLMRNPETAERAQVLSALLGLELYNTGSLVNVRGHELHPDGFWTSDYIEKLMSFAGAMRRDPPKPEGATPW
jgi:hypothetical protein